MRQYITLKTKKFQKFQIGIYKVLKYFEDNIISIKCQFKCLRQSPLPKYQNMGFATFKLLLKLKMNSVLLLQKSMTNTKDHL